MLGMANTGQAKLTVNEAYLRPLRDIFCHSWAAMVANVRKLAKARNGPDSSKLFFYKQIGCSVPDWHRSCL